MNYYEDRLWALRSELERLELDGFVVPLTDEHLSEYVGAYAQRLRWLTGFRGSAASAVVLKSGAAIFVDGRYVLQVRQQVDERHWSYQIVAKSNVAGWLLEHAPEGARIGYDPWLHTKRWVTATSTALAQKDLKLVQVGTNPIDAIWLDRPAPPPSRMIVHPDSVAGKTSADKRRGIVEWLSTQRGDATILCALDSIAWAFNLRGTDVDHTPVALAFALVCSDGTADLFVSPEKLTDEVTTHLGSAVRLHMGGAFLKHLGALKGKRIVVDPERTVSAILWALESAGAQVIEARDPVVLPKAIKNRAEIAGHKAAQVRDGAALCRFLHWFSLEATKGALTELSAAERLRRFRDGTGELRDLSFETISAFGPNGAVIHYHASEETCRNITPGSLYLVDSGGQYIDGTTDVTRTLAVGEPSAEMRDRFTRVLKGHIAIAQAVFPADTRGWQLDILARQYLWNVGRDYSHGTGHGVGAYLGVHEGPQLINRTMRADEPLVPGMIISNEPGYYKAGEYGIRLENLMLVIKKDIAGAEREMLGFETLTFAPMDRTLIDVTMLTDQERTWVDAYHADVVTIIGPHLEGAARSWLLDVTQPLG